jgi:hypothetical protein
MNPIPNLSRAAAVFLVLATFTAEAAEVPLRPNAAYALIDSALGNARRIPAYVTTANEEFSKGINKRSRWVRNAPDGTQFVRVEQTLELAKAQPQTATFIQNGEGFWQLYFTGAIKLMIPFPLERPIPRRLGTAQQICFQNGRAYDESKYLLCTLESDAEFFGMPCSRVTITVSPELSVLLPPSATPAKTEGGKKGGPAKPVAAVTYVYFIEKNHSFVVSWQAFDRTGKKLSEISYQDFRVEQTLPDSLFQVPDGRKVALARNKEEYEAAMKAFRPPAPAKKTR